MNILFLGDSITDYDHCFTSDNLGNGYVKKLSLLPGVFATNGGTDGFTFPDVLRKWRLMYAQNKYDRVVMTCGVNDVGVIADLTAAGRHEAAAAFLEDSITALRTLLNELNGMTDMQKSSSCRQRQNESAPSSAQSAMQNRNNTAPPAAFLRTSDILLLEPFLFPIPQARMHWLPILLEVREGIQKAIANAPCTRYVPTQAALDALATELGYPAVTIDGIHLTDKGHECLAKLVADALGKI